MRCLVVFLLAMFFLSGCNANTVASLQDAMNNISTKLAGEPSPPQEGVKDEQVQQTSKSSKESITKKANKNKLVVKTVPSNARVRILNIKPKYYDGISLPSGKYHIEVSSSGYKSHKEWLVINSDREVNIKLEKKVDMTGKYISFLEKTKYPIPALPIKALKSPELKKRLICKMDSPRDSLEKDFIALDKKLNSIKFANNFDKRTAVEENEKIKEQMVIEREKLCKDIHVPVLWDDFYFIIDDSDSKDLSFYKSELILENGERVSPQSGAMGRVKWGYTTGNYFKIRKSKTNPVYVSLSFTPSLSVTLDSVKEKEKIFLASSKYTGKNSKFKNYREIKGRMFYYLSRWTYKDGFYDKQFPKLTLVPAFAEIPNVGNVKVTKWGKDRDLRDQTDRDSYELFTGE